MNKEQMCKYAYECMVKNNPEEAVKNLLLKDKIIDKAIEYIKEHCIDDDFYINLTNKEKHIFDVLNILKGEGNDN